MLSGSKFLYRDCLIGAGVSLHLFFFSVENIQLYTSLCVSFILSAAFLLKIKSISTFINLLQVSINISFFILLAQWFIGSTPELEPIPTAIYYKTGAFLVAYVAVSIFSYIISSRESQ